VQQYIAASGGEWALNKVTSMYAMGRVRMTAAELNTNDADGGAGNGNGHGHRGGKKGGKGAGSSGEIGGFVLWPKKPELWCLELVVSGCKISAGSDGKVAWRQTPWHQSHASRGPPRPLRRSLQVRAVVSAVCTLATYTLPLDWLPPFCTVSVFFWYSPYVRLVCVVGVCFD
jgi:hypothetical protein